MLSFNDDRDEQGLDMERPDARDYNPPYPPELDMFEEEFPEDDYGYDDDSYTMPSDDYDDDCNCSACGGADEDDDPDEVDDWMDDEDYDAD